MPVFFDRPFGIEKAHGGDLRRAGLLEFGSCWEPMPIILAGRLQPGWGPRIGAGFAGGERSGQQQAGARQQKRAEVFHPFACFRASG